VILDYKLNFVSNQGLALRRGRSWEKHKLSV